MIHFSPHGAIRFLMSGVVSFFPVQQKCGFLGDVGLIWNVWAQEQASCLHGASLGPGSLPLIFLASNSPTIVLTTVMALISRANLYKATVCQVPC